MIRRQFAFNCDILSLSVPLIILAYYYLCYSSYDTTSDITVMTSVLLIAM